MDLHLVLAKQGLRHVGRQQQRKSERVVVQGARSILETLRNGIGYEWVAERRSEQLSLAAVELSTADGKSEKTSNVKLRGSRLAKGAKRRGVAPRGTAEQQRSCATSLCSAEVSGAAGMPPSQGGTPFRPTRDLRRSSGIFQRL